MSDAARPGSKTLGALVDFGLWPALMTGACTGLAWGMAHGRGPLAFNIVYLLLASALFRRVRRAQAVVGELRHNAALRHGAQVLTAHVAVAALTAELVEELEDDEADIHMREELDEERWLEDEAALGKS